MAYLLEQEGRQRTLEGRRFMGRTNQGRARWGQPPLTEQEERIYIAQAHMIGDT